MCPLWPFHYLIIYLVLCLPLFCIAVVPIRWNPSFSPSELRTYISEMTKVNFTIPKIKDNKWNELKNIQVKVICPDILECWPSSMEIPQSSDDQFMKSLNVTANFMGRGNIFFELQAHTKGGQKIVANSENSLPVVVMRKKRVIDYVFTVSVAILVSIIFINFGCALDLNVVKDNFTKPAGAMIGMICQFIFMPLIGYAVGKAVFPDSFTMQLGMFFTGISPSGGASNLWICMLNGNLNLSITITAISNLCAFITIPLWTFTLGNSIFQNALMVVPYKQIAVHAVSLLPPLLIGLFLQRKCPKFSRIMVRILKPFSSCLILFIVVFATITNLYLIKLFTWQILAAGLCLPLGGYVLSWGVAKYCGRDYEDCLAISIETGVQNTGIAIYMLQFTLEQPQADLTTVVPVAVALMTPVPIMIFYFINKFIKGRPKNSSSTEKSEQTITYPIDDKVCVSSLINESLD